ncbi:MAG: MBL fold metallo-hydrolase [Candidatus Magasanikbacteria bacterium]
MHFNWYGNTFFRLKAKPKREEVKILIDPYKPKQGDSPRSLKSDIVIKTQGDKETITLTGEPFEFSTPGECEKDDILIYSTQGHEPDHSMVRIDAEGISVGHMGLTNGELTDTQFETLNGVDVLCIPIGAEKAYEVDKAMKVINKIEPRVIIPMAFQSENDPDAEPIDGFLKEIGEESLEPTDKTIIKENRLPQEETEVVVLKKTK